MIKDLLLLLLLFHISHALPTIIKDEIDNVIPGHVIVLFSTTITRGHQEAESQSLRIGFLSGFITNETNIANKRINPDYARVYPNRVIKQYGYQMPAPWNLVVQNIIMFYLKIK